MPPVLADFEYADRANIVMAHLQKKLSLTALMRAAAEGRTDLLLVEPSHVSGRQARNYITLMLCRDGRLAL